MKIRFDSSRILFIFVAILCCFIVLIPKVKASASVQILSHTSYMDSFGYLHVVGEVQNIGDVAVHYVKIVVTFYDSSHVVVATDFSYTTLDVILPGRKSPFDILFTETSQIPKIDHYSLTVTFSATVSKPIGLQILSNSSYVDQWGYLHIVGEIKNIGSVKTTFVKIIATFYDQSGSVVDCDFTYSNPDELDPGQVAPFDIMLTNRERIPLIYSYALTAESTHYAIIPEFSSMPIVLLLFISTYSIIRLSHPKANAS